MVDLQPEIESRATPRLAPEALRPRDRSWIRARRRPLIAALAAVLLFAAILSALRPPALATVVASRRSLVQRVVATGRVEPPARVTIGSQVAGVAQRVGPEEGDRVAAGDLLVQLDPTEAQAAVEQAQAGVAAAQARLAQIQGTGARIASESLRQSEITLQNAEANLARVEALHQSSAVTQKELDDARKQAEIARSQTESARLQAASSARGGADLLLAEANVAQARAMLAQANARLAQTKLVSPTSGIILVRQVEPGDIVQPGRVLLVLARDGKTRLVAQPDEKSLGYLAPGQQAIASSDAYPSQQFAATLTTIAPAVDAARGTIEVKLDVAEPPAYLRADMTVSVDIEVARAADALVLPADVVQDVTGSKPWVWVIESGRLAKRSLQLGLRGEGFVQVLAGLGAGEEVVVTEGKPLVAGKRVRSAPREAALDSAAP